MSTSDLLNVITDYNNEEYEERPADTKNNYDYPD